MLELPLIKKCSELCKFICDQLQIGYMENMALSMPQNISKGLVTPSEFDIMEALTLLIVLYQTVNKVLHKTNVFAFFEFSIQLIQDQFQFIYFSRNNEGGLISNITKY